MTAAAEISSGLAALVIVGLVVGLVVLLVVIFLLKSTLAPLSAVLADLRSAKTAPMLERGVPGTDQLGQTRRLAESVPPLALAYLQKISRGVRPAAPAAISPAAGAPPRAAAAPVAAGSDLPAWKKFQAR